MAGMTSERDELLTIEEVLAVLRVSRTTFGRWRRQGRSRRVSFSARLPTRIGRDLVHCPWPCLVPARSLRLPSTASADG
jgi:hypothetical protein